MLEKTKEKVESLKKDFKKKKAEKAFAKEQKRLDNERKEAERIQKQQEDLQKEYGRLVKLDDKELMVELIFAVRGFYSTMESLKIEQERIWEAMEETERRIDDLSYEIDALRQEIQD